MILILGREDKFKAPRTKRMWTEEETDMLKHGLQMYGHNWKQIALHYSILGRTPVQLKDRARNVRKIMIANEMPLGVWDC